MNRSAFFDHLSVTDPRLFPDGMSAGQRAGLSLKLDVWAKWYAADYPLTYLAAALGQIYRETGGRMEPVLEAFAPDRKTSAERLQKAYDAGRLKWVKTPYWLPDETGRHPVGGGDIQLTHYRSRYIKNPPFSRIENTNFHQPKLWLTSTGRLRESGLHCELFRKHRGNSFGL